ncbi:hypothetical protein V6N11_025624 [Hibiscus sabdariffa]|uniref:Uncharacterized protein n=1 Tax=Hibiscus sabdariffa TaxID=183260 RepID=A0ABR2SU19_9ROSI
MGFVLYAILIWRPQFILFTNVLIHKRCSWRQRLMCVSLLGLSMAATIGYNMLLMSLIQIRILLVMLLWNMWNRRNMWTHDAKLVLARILVENTRMLLFDLVAA